jgi:hypothetical protein
MLPNKRVNIKTDSLPGYIPADPFVQGSASAYFFFEGLTISTVKCANLLFRIQSQFFLSQTYSGKNTITS